MLNAIALLIPVFLLIVSIEWYISHKKQNNKYSMKNTLMNMTIGAIDQIGSLFYFALLYFVMDYVYIHLKVIQMENTWRQWVLAYIAVDFMSYWYHRLSHRVNILWAGHVTHHSSELFNLSNGFRTSLFQGINRIIFWALLPIFGFSPIVLVVILKVSGIYDFFLHTEYIPQLKLLEKIFITPSLHRVHHGKNDIYIDKNYGSTFVIWDKLFGTFQEETEVVYYGIKGPYTDNNPFKAIGHYYQYLWKTIQATPQWFVKIKLLFMPPDWKPKNTIPGRKPSFKYTPYLTSKHKIYAGFQISCCIVGIITILTCKNFLSNWEFTLCAGIFIITMCNSTLIFNESIRKGYMKRELIQIISGILLAIITMLLYHKIYLMYIILFLSVSLILKGKAEEKNYT